MPNMIADKLPMRACFHSGELKESNLEKDGGWWGRGGVVVIICNGEEKEQGVDLDVLFLPVVLLLAGEDT